MCGICGIYNKQNHSPEEKRLVDMRDVMMNRGPDDAGLFIEPGIGLGHRRLSIVDLTETGHQPMHTPDGRYTIVYNGEIYNFPELKKELEQRGILFHSTSDTEVILQGYAVWGTEVFQKMNGMFALALWDTREKVLILARDRLGKKPLYYLETPEEILFASDLKAILQVCGFQPEIDRVALDAFLYHTCVPQNLCIFKGVKKLPPAHFMMIRNGESRMERFWQLRFDEKDTLSESAWLDKIEEELTAAVRRRLISDVPLGAFLSGGIDSSLIVALMKKIGTREVKTFSIGFAEQAYNELPYARKVAEKYSDDHQELIVEPDALDILTDLVWEYGEPFADSSALPSYYVAKMARQHVTVVLTGDGGDEAFAGYTHAPLIALTEQYRKYCPALMRKFLIPWMARQTEKLSLGNGVFSKFRTLASAGDLPAEIAYRETKGWNRHRQLIYRNNIRGALVGVSPSRHYAEFFKNAPALSDLDRMLYTDYQALLADDFLPKIDVACMRHSLEARSPFLDYQLIETAARIPASLKLKGYRQKYLLKKLAERYLPREIIYRKKSGFVLPVAQWFRQEFGEVLKTLLFSPRALAREYFYPDYIRHVIEEHQSGRADHVHRLWSLLWLELWHLIFIDKVLSPTDSLKEYLREQGASVHDQRVGV